MLFAVHAILAAGDPGKMLFLHTIPPEFMITNT
jgi:hypothetical protein